MYWEDSREKTLELCEKQIKEQDLKVEAAEIVRGNIIIIYSTTNYCRVLDL